MEQLQGLSTADVKERIAAGQVNARRERSTRNAWTIVRRNVFNRFNAIYAALAAIVLSTGHWIDAMFGTLIVVNSIVGIIQELRAKATLDRLQIVAQAKPRVRRDGQAQEISPSEVVRDDLIELGPGDQVVVDGQVVQSDSLEINESLLTGESDAILKGAQDEVLAGSFVVSGSGSYRATKVGDEGFAAQLEQQGREFTLVNSELRNGINRILGFISWILIPTGMLSIYNQLSGDLAIADALVGMVAALVPMVPEGLILMTTTAFAVGVIRLGRRNCLVNELPAIEGLARVDIVCADKTGTLTENRMHVSDVIQVTATQVELPTVLAAIAASDPRPNASMQAISAAFREVPSDWEPVATLPFSSAWKFSGVDFGANGKWLVGAPEVLLTTSAPELAQANRLAARGLRVLLLATTTALPDPSGSTQLEVSPIALLVLEQTIRSDARETLDYFKVEGVEVKIISGDNATSVAAVSQSVGLVEVEAIDARQLPAPHEPEFAQTVERATVFGRVAPEQKRDLLRALQSRGHTVAMTGDGVNDVLALKDADIGVAMGSGSPATRAVAQLVLLDDKFATLPHVVAEGRRVIGNIERVSALFLTKTVYSVLLALLVGLPGILGAESLPFPFLPRHITITGWFTIGIPAFILSLAPNYERARPGFVGRVMRFAIPSGAVIAAASFSSYLLARGLDHAAAATAMQASSSVLMTLILISLWVLAVVARPYVWWKVLLVGGMTLSSSAMFLIPFTREVFELDLGNSTATAISAACGLVGIAAIEVVRRFALPAASATSND